MVNGRRRPRGAPDVARDASGPSRPSSGANGQADEHSRVSAAERSFRSDRSGSKGAPTPRVDQYGSGASHKRTASGNFRTASKVTEEVRSEQHRVTERTYEARIQRHRVKSSPKPYRKNASAGKGAPEGQRQRSSDSRLKESVSDVSSAPWNPEATLLPHTTAPLASRASFPPLASTVPQAPQPRALSELSLEVQEATIVEDLLFVFMGYEGQYIRFAKGFNPDEERDRLFGPSFRILPGLDPSLHDLSKSMLKMATYYYSLTNFVDVLSQSEFGVVNHALCASIRKSIQDYLITITQLETQFLTKDTFTIHVLNIHCISTCQMMHQMYALAQELLKKNALLDDESEEEDSLDDEDYDKVIERLTDGHDLLYGGIAAKKICKGGNVLGIITRRLETMAGDPAARSLLTEVLRDASRPYMVMLNEWLHQGSIKDPHAEYLVKEQQSIRRERLEQDYTDEYWERRYTIRDQDVPPQLEGVKHKVLLAGKYLNVVRECGGVDVSQVVADVPLSFDDARFLDNVNNAYSHANQSLMQLLLTTHALPARLRSMKHYFFLDPSDYFSHFLELGASELRKPVKSVNTGKLQSLLDLVLRQPGSLVAMDPFKEDVKVEMNEVTLTKSLQRVVNITGIEQGEILQPLSNQPVKNDKNATGFTSLQLDYSVPFPVSLVISRKTVWRYQALFRHFLSLRYLESQLSTTWQTQTRGVSWAHKGPDRGLEIWKRRAWTLRARMLIFVQQLLYFCTAEVIEPNWNKFMTRLEAKKGDAEREPRFTRTVDELMQDHVDFLDTCLKECMLTNSKLLRIHSKLMQTCTIFAVYTNWLTRELEKCDPDLSGTRKPSTMTTDQWRRFQASRQAPSATTSAAHQPQQQDAESGDSGDARFANLEEIIRKWEANFSRHLQILLDALNHYAATETVALLSLCARLSTANHGTEYAGLGADEEAP